MRKYLCILFVVSILPACGSNRVVNQNDGTIASDHSSPAEPSSFCAYPEGICDFDANCPSGYRCDGALHTTDIPHAFVCRGICVPKATNSWACEPSPESPLFVSLFQQGDKVFAHIRNISCRAVYRWVDDCCHDMGPRIDVRQSDGNWMPADCLTRDGACCDEPAYCEILRPGEQWQVEISALSTCTCAGTQFRLFQRYFEDPSCADLDDDLPLGAFSNPLSLHCR